MKLASIFSCLCLFEHDFNPQFKGVLINPGCHIYIDIGFKNQIFHISPIWMLIAASVICCERITNHHDHFVVVLSSALIFGRPLVIQLVDK